MGRSRRRRLARGAAGGLLACLCLAVPASNSRANPFQVAIVHSRSFDAACSLLRGYPIDPAWRGELEAMLPRIRELWSSEGQLVLDRAFRLSGKRLHGRHKVLLTLCDIPSSSRLGTIVNMRHALASFAGEPVPLRYKIVTADHELLHDLLAKLDLSQSRLLALHAHEAERVRTHLHLFALMKAALQELGREDLLAELQRIDGGLPESAYRRAWQIIEATPDGHRAYVEEIRLAR